MEKPHVYAIADTAIREMIRGEFAKAYILSIATSAIGHNF